MEIANSSKLWRFDGTRSPVHVRRIDLSTAVQSHRPPRRGTMFIETAIGVALAVVVMIAVAQLVAVVAKQRREVAASRLATQAVANVMERVIVLPWNELTTEAAARFDVADESWAAFDDPQLSIDVSIVDDTLPTKQIEIALSWRDQANRRVEPTRLVAWKHQPPAGE